MKLCRKGLHDLDDPAVAYVVPSTGVRICGACHQENVDRWRVANPARLRVLNRNWYVAHAAAVRAKARQYIAEHPIWAATNRRKQNARRLGNDPNPDLTAKQWSALLLAAHSRCQYCLKVMAPKEITVDHVEPNKNGGSLTLANVVPCCPSCNHGPGGKFAKTVEEWLSPRGAAAFRRRHALLLAHVVRILAPAVRVA